MTAARHPGTRLPETTPPPMSTHAIRAEPTEPEQASPGPGQGPTNGMTKLPTAAMTLADPATRTPSRTERRCASAASKYSPGMTRIRETPAKKPAALPNAPISCTTRCAAVTAMGTPPSSALPALAATDGRDPRVQHNQGEATVEVQEGGNTETGTSQAGEEPKDGDATDAGMTVRATPKARRAEAPPRADVDGKERKGVTTRRRPAHRPPPRRLPPHPENVVPACPRERINGCTPGRRNGDKDGRGMRHPTSRSLTSAGNAVPACPQD